MTRNQARWAEQHNWHLSTMQENGEYAVSVVEIWSAPATWTTDANGDDIVTSYRIEVSTLMFDDSNELLQWAGY